MNEATYFPDKSVLRKQYYAGLIGGFIGLASIPLITYYTQGISTVFKILTVIVILAYFELIFILNNDYNLIGKNKYVLKKDGLDIYFGKTNDTMFISYSQIEDAVIHNNDLLILIPDEGILLQSLNKRSLLEMKNSLNSKINKKESANMIKKSEKVNKKDLYLVLVVGILAIIILVGMFYYALNMNLNNSPSITHFCDGVEPFNEQNLPKWWPFLEYRDNTNEIAESNNPNFKINKGDLELHNEKGLRRTSISRRFKVDNTRLQDHKISFKLETLKELESFSWETPYFRIHFVDKNLKNLEIIYWIFMNEATGQIFTENHPFYISEDLKSISYTGDLLSLLKVAAPNVKITDIDSIKVSAGAYGFGKEMLVRINPINLSCD